METMVNQERSSAEAGVMEQTEALPPASEALAAKEPGVTVDTVEGTATPIESTQPVKEPVDDGLHMPPPEPVAPADVQLARNPSFTSIASGAGSGRPGSAASTGLVSLGGGEGTPGKGDLQQTEAWKDPTRLAAFLLARQQRLEGLNMQILAQVGASDSLAFSAKETETKVAVHIARSKQIPESLVAALETLIATVARRDAAVTAVSQASLAPEVTQELPAPTDVSGLLDAKELAALMQGQSLTIDSDTPTPTPSAMPMGPSVSVRDVLSTRPEQPLTDASEGGKAKKMSFRMANTAAAARSKPSGFTPLPGQILSPGSAAAPGVSAGAPGLGQGQGSEPASTDSSAITAPFNGTGQEQGEATGALVVDHATPRPDSARRTPQGSGQSSGGGDPMTVPTQPPMSPTSERAASFDLPTLQSEALRLDTAVAQAKARLIAWDGYTARLRACISDMNRRGMAAMRVDEAGAAWRERLQNATGTVKEEAVAYEMALKEARSTPRGSPTPSGLSSDVLRPVDGGGGGSAGTSTAHAAREDAEWKEVMDRAEAEKAAVLAKAGGTPRGSPREAPLVAMQAASEQAGEPTTSGVQVLAGGGAPVPLAAASPAELQAMPASLPTTTTATSTTVDTSPVPVADAKPSQEAPVAAVAHAVQQKAVMPVDTSVVPRPTSAERTRPAAIPEVGAMPKQKGFMGWCASLCAPKK